MFAAAEILRRALAERGFYVRRIGFPFLKDDVSQNMEYSFLSSFIKPDWPKVVVDVGANDGKTYSNTYNFIKKGYYGVLVEPNRKLHPAIEKNLQGTEYRIFPFAASSSRGEATLRMDKAVDGKQLMASISGESNEWFDRVLSDEVQSVSMRRLDDMLSEAGAPKDFTLLSVDTEGHDLEVLGSLGEWRPRIIVSEIFPWNKETYHRKMKWIVDNKYLFVGHIGCNEVYLSFDQFEPGAYKFFGHHI